MAVITISASEIIKLTGLKISEVLESLNDIGMPCKMDENEIGVEEKNDKIYVEVTPNRPDLFSIEGIARALNAFHGKKIPIYKAKKANYLATIDASVGASRPYLVSAVVKNVNMNEQVLKSLIQLQEKLHETVGRKRKKLAIGIHDADAVVFPLTYKFVKNEQFVPLDFEKEMDVSEILKNHPKGRMYAHLVKDEYPMLYDQKGVISFPPIINSERTRVTEKTKNLVIEITGTHLSTLSGVLNILVYALADRGGEIYEVKVGEEFYPKLASRKMKLEIEKINVLLGEKFSERDIHDHLARLGWGKGKGYALIPPYRIDISHYADVAEDVAISYGYNNFVPSMPDFFSPGMLAYSYEDVREAMIGMGFVEMVNYTLTNEEKLFDEGTVQRIINPKTKEFTLLRTGIIGSLLENVALNKSHPLPIKIFEIGRLYLNEERISLGFAISDERLDFSAAKGVLQALEQFLDGEIVLRSLESPIFIKGRGASVFKNGEEFGKIGEVSPDVLERFGIQNPVVVCELILKKIK